MIEPENKLMKKLKKILLTLSLIELAVGLSNARPNAFFYLGLPIGAILFGLFLIVTVLEKESAIYDEQQRAAGRRPDLGTARPESWTLQQEVAHHPDLTMAHPH